MKRLLGLILVLCLAFSGCSGENPKRVEDSRAMPVQHVIDGVLNNDPKTWRSAFLPAYDKAVEEQEVLLGTCTDYNIYVSAKLQEAKNVHIQNFGTDLSMEFSNVEVKPITFSERPDMFEEYKDIFTLSYRLDISSIQEVCEVSGEISIWGNESSETRKATYVTVKYQDKWYLHPAFYNLTF